MDYKKIRDMQFFLTLLCLILFVFLAVVEKETGISYAPTKGFALSTLGVFLCGTIVAHLMTRTERGGTFARYLGAWLGLSSVILISYFTMAPVMETGTPKKEHYVTTKVSKPSSPVDTEAELIDCYINGLAVRTTRVNCAQLSKREQPQVVVQQPQVQYVPQTQYIPLKSPRLDTSRYNSTMDKVREDIREAERRLKDLADYKIQVPKPDDILKTCTKCEPNFQRQVVCSTYKSVYCY